MPKSSIKIWRLTPLIKQISFLNKTTRFIFFAYVSNDSVLRSFFFMYLNHNCLNFPKSVCVSQIPRLKLIFLHQNLLDLISCCLILKVSDNDDYVFDFCFFLFNPLTPKCPKTDMKTDISKFKLKRLQYYTFDISMRVIIDNFLLAKA